MPISNTQTSNTQTSDTQMFQKNKTDYDYSMKGYEFFNKKAIECGLLNADGEINTELFSECRISFMRKELYHKEFDTYCGHKSPVYGSGTQWMTVEIKVTYDENRKFKLKLKPITKPEPTPEPTPEPIPEVVEPTPEPTPEVVKPFHLWTKSHGSGRGGGEYQKPDGNFTKSIPAFEKAWEQAGVELIFVRDGYISECGISVWV